MIPLKTDFCSPTFDFFKPKRTKDSWNFLGVEAGEKSLYLIITYYPTMRPKKTYRTRIPSNTINKVYINNLGGWSIDFSEEVEYSGCGGGGVQFRAQSENFTYGIPYAATARVRTPDGEVVWENYLLPNEKKSLESKV